MRLKFFLSYIKFKQNLIIKNGNLYMYEAFDLSNTYRRMKGGSWGNGNKDCAIFHRGCNQAINVKEYFCYFGFRIVRTI